MDSAFNRSVSRRRMLGGSATLLGGAVLAASVGCGDDDDGDDGGDDVADPTATSGPQPTAAPRTGGDLRYAVQGDLNLTNGAPFTRQQGTPLLVFESLIRYEDSPAPTPVLADEYQVSPDFTQVTVSLKSNAVFHDGSPVTPEDVIFGIEAIMDPEKYNFSSGGQLKVFASRVVDSSVVDERTMVFTFDSPMPNVNDFFAQLPVTKKSTYAQLQSGDQILGTGPYMFESWSPGVGYTLTPSPNWHDDRGPYLDGIEVIQFADTDAIGQAYDAGDIHVAPASPLFAKLHPDEVKIAAKWGIIYVGLNVENPLFEDKRVRQALFLAIDRKRIVDEMLEGLVELTTQPWDPGSPAFDPTLEGEFYDPDRSKALLSEAGFSQSGPITFDHYATHSMVGAQLGVMIQDNFSAVGVDIELVGHDVPDMNQKLFKRSFDAGWMLMTGFSPFTPVTVITMPLPFQDNNPSKYVNPEFLDIKANLAALDPFSPEAMEEYRRFNELFHDDPWLLPVAPYRGLSVAKPEVQGWKSFIEPMNYLGSAWLDA